VKPPGSLLQAFRHAVSGIAATIKNERNMRIELVFAFLAVLAGFILQISVVSWAVILILIGAVLAAELFNAALESLVNLSSPDLHPLAKHAKDAAAGAVLILALVAAIVGLIIYIDAAMRLVE
jgi:diacylglycerol kinase